VKNGRLYMFTDEADTVPGPRAYLTIRKVSLVIHPPEGEGGQAPAISGVLTKGRPDAAGPAFGSESLPPAKEE
jgi:hypothetical protein